MIETESVQTFIDQVTEQIAIKSEQLSRGSAEHYHDYAGACGVIQGLRLSLHLLEDILSPHTEETDE